jgi:hypothetical protein
MVVRIRFEASGSATNGFYTRLSVENPFNGRKEVRRVPLRDVETVAEARTLMNTGQLLPVMDVTASGAKLKTGRDIILATKPYASDHTVTSWWHVLSTMGLLFLALQADWQGSSGYGCLSFITTSNITPFSRNPRWPIF